MARDEVTPFPLGDVRHGEREGNASAEQFPNVPCRLAWIKAAPANTGVVYIGSSSAVTAAAGTDNLTTGFPLSAGEVLGPLEIPNLNKLYFICSDADQDLMFLALG